MARILITPKINPDLDGVACAYAYAKLLKTINPENEYVAGIYGRVQNEAEFLLEKFQISDGLAFDPAGAFDKFVIVDASDIKGMPGVIRIQDVVEVIDHREASQAGEIFNQARLNIRLVGAAATLIFNKFQEAKQKIDFNSAVLLYGAIFSNTLNLQTNVTDNDQQAIAVLENILKVKIGNPREIIQEMFEHKTKYIAENLEECLRNDFKVFDNGLGVAQLEGFGLAKLLSEQGEKARAILRSLKTEFKLAKIFLTAADIKDGHNIFLTIDADTAEFLAEKLSLLFNDKGEAKNGRLYLRKQISPILVDRVETRKRA